MIQLNQLFYPNFRFFLSVHSHTMSLVTNKKNTAVFSSQENLTLPNDPLRWCPAIWQKPSGGHVTNITKYSYSHRRLGEQVLEKCFVWQKSRCVATFRFFPLSLDSLPTFQWAFTAQLEELLAAVKRCLVSRDMCTLGWT